MNKLRLFKRIFFWTAGILVFLMVALYALARIYNDELKELALAEINKGLKTKVDVREVELTLIERFPRASLRFSDVLIQGTMSAQDTLLAAETVHLEFGLFDILRGKYTVRTVGVSHAKVMIKRNAEGENNYRFWKETEGDGSDFRFSVDELIIEKSTLEWADLQARLWAEFAVDKARLRGNYAYEILETQLNFSGSINTWQMPWSPKLEDKKLKMEGKFIVDSGKNLLRFDPLSILLNDLPFDISGTIDTGESLALNLEIGSPDADLAAVVSILPEEIDEKMADYAISGRANLKASLKGIIQSGRSPEIEIEIPVVKGNFKHRPSGAEMTKLNTDIVYTLQGGVSKFDIRNLEGSFQSSPFSIQGSILNPASPRFDLSCRGEFPLAEVLAFFRLDSLVQAQGVVSLSGNFAGHFQDPANILPSEWSQLQMSGNLQFEKVALSMAGNNTRLEKLKGRCDISGNTFQTQDLQVRVNSNDFVLNGNLTGLLPYLLTDSGVMSVNAECTAGIVNLDTFLSGGSASGASDINMPERITLKLGVNWQKISFRQFAAEEVQGSLNYAGGVLSLDPLSLRTCDGKLNCSLKLTDKLTRFDLSAMGDLQAVDLKKLFHAFENFGQTFLTKDNLKGKLTSNFVIGMQTDKKLEIRPKTLTCVAQMKVENGELIQLTSLRNVSDYLKSKKVLSSIVDADGLDKKLRHITFATLENTIRVKDGVITIPFMEIKSSALDITAEGQQTFDNKIDYTLGFYLRDVLMKKKRNEGETDDGLGKTFFIRMTGTTENPIFSIDKEAAKDKRKKDIEAEKALIKEILKEEFKGEKGDAKPSVNDEKPATIDVKWEEPEPTKEEEPKKKKKRSLKDLLGGEEEEDF